MKRLWIFCLVLLALAGCNEARDRIRIVGSSTVYPFVTVAAERFGRATEFHTPIVESTGTGGGFKLFCGGVGPATPDIANASRPIKESEKKLCAKNGVRDLIELAIGYDGIVLANDKKGPAFALTREQVFLALAKEVPGENGLRPNPYRTWKDIDKSLPDLPIEVYGPPPTSGTRDSFVELVMEEACKNLPAFKGAYPDSDMRKKACHVLREDGAFIDAGENDNIIVQKLTSNPHALGIFGYSFLEENAALVKAASMDGVTASFENIASGKYPVARSLFVYGKGEHFNSVPGLREFLEELASEKALGDDGYLIEKGLIPMPYEIREAARAQLSTQ